jgi:hypothetical protein
MVLMIMMLLLLLMMIMIMRVLLETKRLTSSLSAPPELHPGDRRGGRGWGGLHHHPEEVAAAPVGQ